MKLTEMIGMLQSLKESEKENDPEFVILIDNVALNIQSLFTGTSQDGILYCAIQAEIPTELRRIADDTAMLIMKMTGKISNQSSDEDKGSLH
jgi:hypothetical protein